jgi:hypothetical protein
MLDLPLDPSDSLYGATLTALAVLFVLVKLGHHILDLGQHALDFLRDYRNFREGS